MMKGKLWAKVGTAFRHALPLLMLILVACQAPPAPTDQPTEQATQAATDAPEATSEATDAPAEELVLNDDTLYVSIIWHQHQPIYYKDPATGVYQRPWVRLHATKDYLDMATTLAEYPDVHATYNITPSLIRQLDDLAAGTKDLYWVHTEIPAAELTDEQKQYILDHFFDINPKIIARFPRLQELANMRGEDALATWETQDYLDLQVLFNLGWMDPDWLAVEPLASLVAKERGYTEADKRPIFDETERIIAEVIPYHADMQRIGQIEVTMTPFAHPILPLLLNTEFAREALPQAELPTRFAYPDDAKAHMELGVQFYEEHFGMAPRGMWPAEGSVSELMIDIVARGGIQWMASDEDVLAQSLPDFEDFTRDSNDTVQQADALYRPYLVEQHDPVAMIYRDHLISDLVGFQYSGMDGEEAAADFMERLNNIQAQLEAEGATGPHLVTVLLDGENAWEHYDNDGKAFLHAMYRSLSEAENIQTVTPSEYLAALGAPPEREIDTLFAGSWIDGTFSTWIGEPEENTAWEYLRMTREAVQTEIDAGNLTDDELATVMDTVYAAEGSDWFWWYGSDQNSGSDQAFDQQFRLYLEEIYNELGLEVPGFVYVPIIPDTPIEATVDSTGLMEGVVVDGVAAEGEWDTTAGQYAFEDQPVSSIYYGFDLDNMYLRLETVQPFAERLGDVYGFYFNVPGAGSPNAYTRYTTLTGFGANRLLELGTTPEGEYVAILSAADGAEDWTIIGTFDTVAVNGSTIEIGIPLATFYPGAGSGDRILMRATYSPEEGEPVSYILPVEAPVQLVLPDLPLANLFMDVADPTGDDHGPGTYTYPLEPVFLPGVFDIEGLQAGYDDEEVKFRVDMVGPIRNNWGSPNGLSVMTVDVYIDVDGAAAGQRILLPGRNAALTEDHAWDYAITAEGWESKVFTPSADGPVEVPVQVGITVNPGLGQVTISIPQGTIPGNPEEWSITVVALGQEGFPQAGVLRVRDVEAAAAQWRFGGAPDDNNHTRIIDVVLPEGTSPTQEESLSDYEGQSENIEDYDADDYPQVGMIEPE